MHCLRNIGQSKELFNNIFGDINKVISDKIELVRELERRQGVASVDFDSMFNW